MQIFHCMVMLAGDMTNVCFRGDDSPVSYPEMILLGLLHGENAIFEVKCVADEPRDNAQERRRLELMYGDKIMASTFPGKWALLPEGDRRYRPPVVVAEPEQDEFAKAAEEEDALDAEDESVGDLAAASQVIAGDPRSAGAIRKARAREKARSHVQEPLSAAKPLVSATVPPGQLPPTHIPGSGAPLPDIFA